MVERKTDNLITVSAAEKLIRSHDADCALFYLWQCFRESSDRELAAGELCMTRAQIDNAAEKLSRMGFGPEEEIPSPGIVSATGSPTPEPADDPPDYSGEEIVQVLNSDKSFQALKDRLQEITGKTLSRSELSSLLGIYRHLGLPADVIYVLFQYCSDISHSMYGNSRTPTVRYIEKTAYSWANAGVSSAEEAEAYAEKHKALLSETGKIKQALEIYDRKLTTNEQGYITSWIEMGYHEEAIRMAYERTIDNIGKLSMPYMNKIIIRWNEDGLFSVEQIEQKDHPEKVRSGGRLKRSGRTSGGADEDFDPDEIDKISITKG
ncbi:MAG: DnaD domain protein [Eubacteriales bacterium]|nr:DnaD domain protein [Eubacteriales bacterium]